MGVHPRQRGRADPVEDLLADRRSPCGGDWQTDLSCRMEDRKGGRSVADLEWRNRFRPYRQRRAPAPNR